jgi:metal transporter CNNM
VELLSVSLAVSLLIVAVLVFFSAICSGLNIALMALDINSLRRKAKLGNVEAQRALELRSQTHLTLSSILLTNVAAVSATSLVLEEHFNGFIAGALGTLLIVVLGEVVPQAIFAKRPLFWVSRFAPVLKFMIVVTYVISKPLQLLLNKLIGHAPHSLQSRHELGLLIAEHLGPSAESELDEDEVEIMRGALQLSEKRVSEILTPIEDVFWLTPATELTQKRINEIKANSYSRIPIFNKQLTICFGILLMKDLVDIDFDEKTYRVDELLLHPVNSVGSRTALDTMFRVFINSHSHLIPIERDDKIIGVVTIEDLIEEILGHEIQDETDRRKKR